MKIGIKTLILMYLASGRGASLSHITPMDDAGDYYPEYQVKRALEELIKQGLVKKERYEGHYGYRLNNYLAGRM